MSRNSTTAHYSWLVPSTDDPVNSFDYWGIDNNATLNAIDSETNLNATEIDTLQKIGVLNYGNIVSISKSSSTTIQVDAGAVIALNNNMYRLTTTAQCERATTTVSEIEYLFAYVSVGVMGFELDTSAVPLYDTTLAYWIKTGDNTRRYIHGFPKDGGGSFYDFDITGAGANALKVDWNPANTGGLLIRNGDDLTATVSYAVDLSSYMYQPAISNIIRHELVTLYVATGLSPSVRFQPTTTAADNILGYDTFFTRGGALQNVETELNSFYIYSDASVSTAYIQYTYSYTRF